MAFLNAIVGRLVTFLADNVNTAIEFIALVRTIIAFATWGPTGRKIKHQSSENELAKFHAWFFKMFAAPF